MFGHRHRMLKRINLKLIDESINGGAHWNRLFLALNSIDMECVEENEE